MYIMFVDDSGSTRPCRGGGGGGGGAQDAGEHMLCGLVVHERGLRAARESVNGAKRAVFGDLDPAEWELHAYDAWNNRGWFSGEGRALNLAGKDEVFSRAAAGVAESGAALVAVVVRKGALPGRPNGPRIRALAWKLLEERFEEYLADRGGGDLGMMISDSSNDTNERGIRESLRSKAGIGRRKKKRDRVIEDVVFKDSRSEPLIQGADMAAYIIQRHRRGDPRFAGHFDRLKACVWKPNGAARGPGIKEYPGAGRRLSGG